MLSNSLYEHQYQNGVIADDGRGKCDKLEADRSASEEKPEEPSRKTAHPDMKFFFII